MNRLVSLAITAVIVAGCAATPPAEESTAIVSSETAAATDKAVVAAAGAEHAAVEVVGMDGEPAVEMQDPEPEIVCKLERRTGSHRAVKVCRSRSEIERSAQEGKETFGEIMQRKGPIEY